jgi:hypothetical protein
MSWILTIAWSFSHSENANLNFLGRVEVRGCLRKYLVVYRAYGKVSKISSGQIPERCEEVTFLTVFPHASRVVIPTLASDLKSAGTSWSLT